MNSPQKSSSSLNGTMYNLTNKRTLPREVIKWMQGLDLSYSVKDYRKDMSNGFLIAEIISRYQPGRIPMHAFENTQNVLRRDNNWKQLSLFFRKYSLREIQIGSEEFGAVMKSSDPKSQQLYQFICRLFSICTKRTLTENTPIIDLPPTQPNNPNLTASYLLKQDGLQKLQSSNSNMLGNKSQINDHSRVDQKLPERVPTRKIVPNLDGSAGMVDVTGIGIRADNRKMTSKRKSWEAGKDDSNYVHLGLFQEQDNVDGEKLIFDYLNDIIEECLPENDFALRELLVSQNGKYRPTQALKKAIANLDKQFFCNFLHQISLNINELVPILLRELNQTWKFFTYFIRLFRHFASDNQQFILLHEIVRSYAISCHAKQSKRIQKVFLQSLATSLISQVKASKQWKKRQKIMSLVYDFQGRDISEKKVVLNKLKESLGSSNLLYIQWLSVLVKEQTLDRANIGNKLIEDYVYYAHQYIGSSLQALRTSALKILYEISKTQSYEVIQAFFYAKAIAYQNGNSDPEQTMLLILIYCNLLKQLINSKQYQNLIKGNNTNNLVKIYNPDNQKNLQDIKKRTQILGQTIYRLFNNTSDVTVRQICARKAIPFIPQSQFMMQIFLQFISLVREKEEFMRADESQYELKSIRVECGKVEIGIVEEYSNQILVQIISRLLKQGANIQGYLFLINHSLKHLNLKKVNMQIWQDISLHIVKPYTDILSNPIHSALAFEGIQNICLIYFNFDMKIRQLSTWLANGICDIYHQNNTQCLLQINIFNQFLNSEYSKGRHDSIRLMVDELSQLLSAKSVNNLIVIHQP